MPLCLWLSLSSFQLLLRKLLRMFSRAVYNLQCAFILSSVCHCHPPSFIIFNLFMTSPFKKYLFFVFVLQGLLDILWALTDPFKTCVYVPTKPPSLTDILNVYIASETDTRSNLVVNSQKLPLKLIILSQISYLIEVFAGCRVPVSADHQHQCVWPPSDNPSWRRSRWTWGGGGIKTSRGWRKPVSSDKKPKVYHQLWECNPHSLLFQSLFNPKVHHFHFKDV